MFSNYGDKENALGVAYEDGKVVVWRCQKNQHETIGMIDAPGSPLIYLRMTANSGDRFLFAASRDGRDWKEVNSNADGSYLPPWDRAVRVALTVGGVEGAVAKFEWLRLARLRNAP
jgi:hypothetical protein